MINQTTLEAIKQLQDLQWFCNIGKLDLNEEVIPVYSWDEAIKYCSQKKWYKIEIDAANFIGKSVREKSHEKYNLWNEIVRQLKPEFQQVIDLKLMSILESNQLPRIVKDCVEWDLLHFLIECEYEDLYPDGFFRKLSHLYLKGHFPCGWNGKYSDFPNGKLIVF